MYTLVKTCHGCGVTLFRQKLGPDEASEYAQDIKFLGAQLGRIEEDNRSIFLYDGLCPECLTEIFINNPVRPPKREKN